MGQSCRVHDRYPTQVWSGLHVVQEASSGVELKAMVCSGGLCSCLSLTHDDVRPHVDQSLGRLVANPRVAASDDHYLFGAK